MAFNLDKNKNRVQDIKKNIEAKKGEQASLERSKEEVMQEGMEIQGSNLEEKAMQTAMEGVNMELENISDRGKELADEMKGDFSELETLREETQETMEGTDAEKKKLEKKKELLDKLGLGKGLESAINELSDSQQNLDSFAQTVTETQKELETVQGKLSGL